MKVRINGEERWIATEDVARYRDALGVVPPIGVPQAFLMPVEDALAGLLVRWARHHGPFLAAEPAARWGVQIDEIETELEKLLVAGDAAARRVPAQRRRARVVPPGCAAPAAPALAGPAAA